MANYLHEQLNRRRKIQKCKNTNCIVFHLVSSGCDVKGEFDDEMLDPMATHVSRADIN